MVTAWYPVMIFYWKANSKCAFCWVIVYVELEQVAYTMFLDAFVTELKLNGGCPEQEGSGVGEGGGGGSNLPWDFAFEVCPVH